MQKRKLTPAEVQHRQRTRSGSVLTPEIVGKIKWKLLHKEATARELAAIWDVSLWTIRAIARGDVWGWVEADPGDNVDWTGEEVRPEVLTAAKESELRMARQYGLVPGVEGEMPVRTIPPLATVALSIPDTPEEIARKHTEKVARAEASVLEQQKRIATHTGKSLEQVKFEWNTVAVGAKPGELAVWLNAQMRLPKVDALLAAVGVKGEANE